MKCQSCGAEIKAGAKFCESCGSQISYEMKKEQEQLNKAGCPKCGSSNVTFNREKQGELRDKNGSAVVRTTVGLCKDCGFTWNTEDNTSRTISTAGKNNIRWWVLGWIFFFPAPTMILIWRKKNTWPTKTKIIVTVIFWVIILALGAGGSKNDSLTNSTTETVTEEIATDIKEVMTVELKVEPNVNADDGTVLFGITTNLPEDTKLMVTVTNDDGFMAQDTVTILNNGTGYTAEFSNHGAGLSGKYNVHISMSLPSLQVDSVKDVIGQKGEYIGGQYVIKAETGDSNCVGADFDFEF